MPIFNECELLPELTRRMESVFAQLEAEDAMAIEWIVVNDGSSDGTRETLKSISADDTRLVVITLSRNFGHQPAIQAGLEFAHGDAVVVMDGDLQDPPELLPQFVAAWKDGAQVVVGKRTSRAESGIRRLLFGTFHRIIARMSDSPIEARTGVFGLFDRLALQEFLRLKERNRFLPGLRSWVGYRQASVEYDRDERAAGTPKQSLGNLFHYAFDAIFSFSHKPLRAIWTFGFLVSLLCIGYATVLVILRLLHINVVPGFTTPTVAILFLGGVQLISIGILGEYLGRVYDEVKQRPLYLIRDIIRQGSERSLNS